MKKIWKYAILLVVLSALLCMSVFAAEKPDVANISGTATVNSNNESFAVQYDAGVANAGKQYLVLMLAGADEKSMPDPTKTKILYVNQDAAGEDGVVKFDNVYPTTVEDSVIWLTGGNAPVALAAIDVTEPNVTVNISGIFAEGEAPKTAVNGDTLTVTHDKACVVLIQKLDGTYEPLTVQSNANGGYEYDISGLEVGENIVVAQKGDINAKGGASAFDARLVFAAATDPTKLTALQYAIADLDGNGIVTAYEARLIFASVTDQVKITW